MKALLEPHSPIWPIARVVAYTGCACAVLAVTASSFDATEIKALAAIAASGGLIEFVKRKVVG